MGTGDRGLSWRPIALVTLAMALLAGLLTKRMMADGNFPPSVPTLALVVLIGIGIGVLWYGWAVRSYLLGRKAGLNALRAARTLALAQAAALTGAGLAGVYLGSSLGLWPDWDLQASQRLLWGYLLGIVASVWLVAAGLIAQHWCRIPPRGDEE